MRKSSLLVLLVAVLLLTLPVMAQPPLPEIEGGEIIASGFNAPQGVLVDPDGNIWVIDGGIGGDEEIEWAYPGTGQVGAAAFGFSAQVVMLTPEGDWTTVANLPSVLVDQESLGGARLAVLDGELYVTSGQWLTENGEDRQEFMGAVVKVDADGSLEEIADTWSYEEANNPDGLVLDLHPYGISAGPDGWLWVADAGANSLYRVDPASGDIEGVTGFSEGLFSPFPNPFREGREEADPVPTAVEFDEEGTVYVSLLGGIPFIPGSTKVVTVSEDGDISDYAVGLTMLTDLQMGPDGELYAVQFGQFTEEGPVPNAGAVIRIKAGADFEIVAVGLPFPTGLSFDADGNAFVALNGVGAPGSGAIVRIDGLTDREGEPLPMPESD